MDTSQVQGTGDDPDQVAVCVLLTLGECMWKRSFLQRVKQKNALQVTQAVKRLLHFSSAVNMTAFKPSRSIHSSLLKELP